MNTGIRRANAWQLYPLIGALVLAAGAVQAVEPATTPPQVKPLTLDEAGRLALQRQPLLDGLTAQSRAARESAVAARQLPDPQLVAGIADLPINTSDAYSLRRDSDTQLQLGLIQEFPRAEKRRLRGERVERDAERLDAEHHLAERTIRRDAALAWLEVWRYEQSLVLTRANLREAEIQTQAVEITLKSGTATQADLLAARLEAARLQDVQSGTEQSIGHARNLLSRWIGDAAWRPISAVLPDAPVTPPIASVLQRVRLHPHLAGHKAEIAIAQTGADIAKADYAPDWRVELGYANRPAFSDMVSLQVGVDLPFFTRNRQDRALASALAQQDAAMATLEDGQRQLESEARLNVDDRTRLMERLKYYDEQLLSQAGQRTEASLISWRSGRGTLAQVLEARRAALDLAMSRLDLQHDAAKHFVQLTYLGAYDTAAADLGYDHE